MQLPLGLQHLDSENKTFFNQYFRGASRGSPEVNCCQLMDEDGNGIQTMKTNMENARRTEALHTDSQCVVTSIQDHQGFTSSMMSECYMEYSYHLLVLEKEFMIYVLYIYISPN